METSDRVLITQLTPLNDELSKLMKQHKVFEVEIDGLKSRRWLSFPEQRRLRELKKMKLRGRDRIEAILADHRRQSG